MLAVGPERVQKANYELREVRSATVGEPIFSVQVVPQRPTYVVSQRYEPPRPALLESKRAPLVPGMIFTATARYPNGDLLLHSRTYDAMLGVRVQASGVPVGWVLPSGEQASRAAWTRQPLFEKADDGIPQEGAFRAEMLYSGLTGSTLRATYREFKDDFARPAFFQELQYELSESRTISYKSIRIEVLDATNMRLEYRVLDDGGLPWLP
jgi:hypothetical protein